MIGLFSAMERSPEPAGPIGHLSSAATRRKDVCRRKVVIHAPENHRVVEGRKIALGFVEGKDLGHGLRQTGKYFKKND